jgi:hypothetical protein
VNIIFQVIIVFIVSILLDIVWGLYIRRTSEGRAIVASNMAALLMLLGAINIVSYTKNRWLLIPIIAGNWIGTFLIVKHDERNKRNAKNCDSCNSDVS